VYLFILALLVLFLVVALAVAFFMYVSLPLAAIACGVGALLGMGAALHEFSRRFAHQVRNRGADGLHPSGGEPAFRGYLYGPVLGDLVRALGYAAQALVLWFSLPLSRVGWFFESFKRGLFLWPIPLALVAGAIAGEIAGFAILVAVALVTGVVVLLTVGVALALGRLLEAWEAAQRRLVRAHYRCDQCHRAFARPVYQCPGCGEYHQRLLPGRYGIFRRRCACDHVSLPTLLANGRADVPAFCPGHHRLPKSIGRLEDVHIPIAGAEQSGKTALVAGALQELFDLDQRGLLHVTLTGKEAANLRRIVEDLGHGTRPLKTGEKRRYALMTRLRPARRGPTRERFLFAYDLAGEIFHSDEIRDSLALEQIRGAVLVIDPASLIGVQEAHGAELSAAADQLHPSFESPEAVYIRLVNAIKDRGQSPRRIPLAVVVTKVDALGVDAELAAMQPTGEGEGDTRVRGWLEAQGARHLTALIGQDFKHVGWFAASALGRLPDDTRRPYVSRGALSPFAWLLSRNGLRIPPPHAAPAAGAAPVSVSVSVQDDYADGTLTTGRRGPRAAHPVTRTAFPAPTLVGFNLWWHALWGVAVVAIALGVYGGLTRIEPAPVAEVETAPSSSLNAQWRRVALVRPRNGSRAGRAIDVKRDGRIVIERGRRRGDSTPYVRLKRGGRVRKILVSDTVATVEVGAGRYVVRAHGARRWRIRSEAWR
jgi:hypothetical protein